MLGRIIDRLTYANVVSTVALFVALGGVSYAATSLPANSVGSAQLKPNAVISAKVANRSLRAVDFALGQLPAGPAGPTGAQGLAGPTGAAGENGKNGATSVVVRSLFVNGQGVAKCNPGERATGGGVFGDNRSVRVVGSQPDPNSGTPTGWLGKLVQDDDSFVNGPGTVYVVCASP